MARRKNVKRIDPRYFLNETVNRNDDGSAMEEDCPLEDEGGEAIDISGPGIDLQVDDVSQLPPEEAFAAGIAVARDAIDQLMGGSQESQSGHHPGQTCEEAHPGEPHAEA